MANERAVVLLHSVVMSLKGSSFCQSHVTEDVVLEVVLCLKVHILEGSTVFDAAVMLLKVSSVC